MIIVNFTLSSFAVWLEGRLRRSRRAPTPLDPETIETEGAPGATVKVAEPGTTI
jgi:glutamate transport system permease protein